MKTGHALAVTAMLGIFALTKVQAKEYKAPKFQLNSSSAPQVNVAQEKDFKEFGENSYRVQEDTYSNRNVASEIEEVEPAYKEEDGRNPSSQAQPPEASPEAKPKPRPKSWKYEE